VFVRRFSAGVDGMHETVFVWDGRNGSGILVPTGGYAAVCHGPGLKWTGKVAVLR
jgi:hypothetical protein